MQRSATVGFIVLTALSCAALVWLHRIDSTGPAVVAKLIASGGYLLTAFSAGAHRHGFGRIVLTGLACSVVGDILLIGDSQRHFLGGLAAFLAAHVAYTTAFVRHGQKRRWVIAAAVPVFIAALLVLHWLAPQLSPALAWPVRVYTAVISIMVVTAFGARGAGGPAVLVVGALMFYVSDLSVAMQRIVDSELPTIIWGLPLYYAAQLCFAVGAAHSASQYGTPENRSARKSMNSRTR